MQGQRLALGATADDVFTYTVSDGKGGFDTAELRIAVTGTNDAPSPPTTPARSPKTPPWW